MNHKLALEIVHGEHPGLTTAEWTEAAVYLREHGVLALLPDPPRSFLEILSNADRSNDEVSTRH